MTFGIADMSSGFTDPTRSFNKSDPQMPPAESEIGSDEIPYDLIQRKVSRRDLRNTIMHRRQNQSVANVDTELVSATSAAGVAGEPAVWTFCRFATCRVPA